MTDNQANSNVSSQEATLAAICHISAIFSSTVLSIFVPVIIMCLSDSPFVRDQAKESLNFQASTIIWAVIGLFACLVLVGFIMLPIVFVCALVFPICAAISALGGTQYRYRKMVFMKTFRFIE